jgi:hypothetical protein
MDLWWSVGSDACCAIESKATFFHISGNNPFACQVGLKIGRFFAITLALVLHDGGPARAAAYLPNGLPNARLQTLAAFRRRKIKIGVTDILRL